MPIHPAPEHPWRVWLTADRTTNETTCDISYITPGDA